MGALTDRYKAILKKQAWHKRLMEWHKDSHPLTKNEDGTPKVFYHGTGADFDTFEVGHGGDFGDGVYFSDSPEYSSEYGNSVYPVNLNIKEPLVLDNRYQMNRLWDEKIAAKDSGDKAALGAMSEWLKSKGYDGIIVSNGLTGDSSGVSFGIVFNPNQIKSIHNKGTFSENSAVITDSVTFDMSFDAESRYIDKSRDMIKINKLIKDAEETLPQPIRSFEDFKKQFPEADTDNNVKLNIHGVSIEFNLYGVWKHLVPQNNTHYDDRNTISGAFVKTIRDPLLIVRQPHKGREIVFYKAFRGSPLYNLAAFKFTNGKFTYYDLKNNMNKVKEIIKTPDQNTLYFKYSRQEKILRTKEWQSEPAINQIIPKNTNQVNMDGAETMNIQELPHETVQMDMAFISTMLTNKELKEKETELKEKYEKANSMIAKSKIIKELSDLATIEEGAFSDVATKTAMKEIDDSEISFSLVPRNAKNITLGDIMEAPLLFSKYPQLRNIKIKHLGARSIYNGQYRPSENALYISPPDLDKEEEKKIDERIDSVKDKEIEIIFGDKKTMLKIMTTNQSEASESYINKARRYLDFLSNLKKQEEKEKNRLSRTYEPQKSIILHELQHAIQEIENWGKGGVPKNKSAKAYEEYRRLWGEQQARAAQHRMDMTKEEKQKESWQDTLKRVEKKYDNPIVKLNHGNSAVITDSITLDSPVKSKLQKEKRGIWNVTFNGKNSTAIYKDIDFIDDAIKFEQGKADYIDNKGNFKNGFGVLHIVKHIGKNQDGWVSEKEIVNIGVAIRNTKPYIKSGKRIYEYYNNFGDRFKIIIGDKKNGERTISFYSNRKAGFGNDSQNYIYNQPFGRRGGSHNAQPATSSTDTIIPKNTNQVNMDGAETMNILQQIKTETSVLAKTKLVKEWRSLGVADKAKIIKEYRNEIKEDYIEIKNIRAEYIKHISIDQFKKEYLIIRKPPKKFFTKTNHDIFVSPKNKEIFNFKKMVFSPRHVSTGLYKRGLMNLLSDFNLTKFGATIKGNIDGVDVVLGTVIEGKISIEDAYRNHGELIDFANSLKIRQLRIEGESSAVITDSIASFGLNNPKYKGKPKEAIAYLMESKKGQVVGAMNHPEIGEIDFVYGNNKRGLKHIFERRLEQWKDEAKVLRFMSHIPEIILSAKSFGKNNKGNIELKSNRYTISLATHNYGKEKIWLLSSLIDRRNKSLGIETVHGDAIQSEPSHTSYQHDNGHILSNSQIIPKNTNQVNMDGAETMNILQQIKTETSAIAKAKLNKQWRSLGALQRAKALKEYNASTSTVNDDVIDALETIKAVLENPDATSPLQNTQRVL